MSQLFVYSDSAIEAAWFKSLHHSFENLESRTIQGRGKNPPVIENLIQYEPCPDIILTDGTKAFLVIEKTLEVPTGHKELLGWLKPLRTEYQQLSFSHLTLRNMVHIQTSVI